MKKLYGSGPLQGGLTKLQRYLVRGLWERGFGIIDTHNFMMDSVQCYIGKDTIVRLFDSFRKRGEFDEMGRAVKGYRVPTFVIDDVSKVEANKILDAAMNELKKQFDIQLTRATDLGTQVDNLIMKRLNKEQLNDAALIKFARDIFERQRILQEKPTSISGREKLTDDEIYARLCKLKKEGRILEMEKPKEGRDPVIIRRREGVVDRVNSTQGTRADTVLESASNTGEGE